MQWIRQTRFVNKGGADQNQQAQEAFYNQLTASYQTDFGQFESLTSSLLSKIQPIINAGPGQYGFDPTEDASLRSTAENADAAATHNAQVAANQQITAANGGAAVVPTGAEEQLQQEADLAGAQKLSSDEQAITQAGYAQGVQNYQTALGQEDAVMGLENPNNFAGAATSGGQAATSATQVAVEADDSWMNMVGGALGGAAGALTSYGLKSCWIAAELYGGWNDPRTDLVRTWLALDFGRKLHGRVVLKLYMLFGERIAHYIKDHPRTRAVFQRLFDKALARAEEWKSKCRKD
jgi:hypothetical protein